MTYTREPITPPLLARLWADLWERGKQEFEQWGISLDDAFHLFLSYAAQSADGGILCADGKPILVAGTCPDGDSSFTFMQASADFPLHYKACMLEMRRGTRAHQGALYIYSVLIHPKASRFFEAMGYTRDEWSKVLPTGATLYRFKRK